MLRMERMLRIDRCGGKPRSPDRSGRYISCHFFNQIFRSRLAAQSLRNYPEQIRSIRSIRSMRSTFLSLMPGQRGERILQPRKTNINAERLYACFG